MAPYDVYIFANSDPILKKSTLDDLWIESPPICIKIWQQNIF